MRRHRKTLQILTETDVHFRPQVIPSSPWEPKVSQMASRSPKGAKGTPRRAPWEPELPKRVPKGCPKSPQGQQNEFQRHPKETNKSENYTHINKIQQTPDPPPSSGRLVNMTCNKQDYLLCSIAYRLLADCLLIAY